MSPDRSRREIEQKIEELAETDPAQLDAGKLYTAMQKLDAAGEDVPDEIWDAYVAATKAEVGR